MTNNPTQPNQGDNMTTTTYTYSYTMHHPHLSEPLIIDAPIARTDRALTAWATIYIMRNFDELVSPEDWIIEQSIEMAEE